MKKSGIGLLAGIALIVVLTFVGLGTLAGNAHAGTTAANVAPPPPKHTHMPPAPAQVGLGYMDASKGKLADWQIVAFLESHRFIGGDVIGGGYPHVSHIKHLTAGAWEKARGATLLLPATEELIQVDIEGPFHLTRANTPQQDAATFAKISVQTVHVLIDVNTGNLEAWYL